MIIEVSYNPSDEISWSIWLINWDQLRLYLWHNKYFWMLLRRYGSVWTRIAYVPELDFITRSSVWLSNHTWSETMYNVSAHQLPQYYKPQRVPFKAWTVSVTWYTCHQHYRVCTENSLSHFTKLLFFVGFKKKKKITLFW